MIRSLAMMASLYAAQGCTNFLASRGATNDASTIVAYNADSGALYGSLYSYPAKKHRSGDMRQIFDWDTGTYLGEIPEAEKTYNVIGNMNQFGLVIGETTYGGIESLQSQPGAIMDYGSLIWVTLQRAKTAREAIYTLDSLMQTYGYASEGESFSIGDGKETWIMELIGKGALSAAPNKLGSVWVARRIPDGYVCAHANQARITTFPKNDKSTTLYASDVISFAREIGLYSGSDDDFSFSDVYDPVTFGGARFCEGRVWSMFGKVMGKEWMDQYLDYALGHNLTNRMPLWVKPKSKVSTTDVMEIFRDHFQGTNLDMSGQMLKDIGAANAQIPYRAHPLTWTSGGKSYVNERPVGTQQTGWNFVATTRAWLPEPIRGVLWFGVDDSATTARIPVYGSATRSPPEFAGKGAQDGVVSPMLKFDMRSAFYAFNLVANWVYTRWELMYPDLYAKIVSVEAEMHLALTEMDEKAVDMLASKGHDECVEQLTQFSDTLGTKLIDTWNTLFGDLFVKFRDGYVVTPNVDELSGQCDVKNVGYPQQWYDDIVASTGDHLLNLDEVQSKKNVKPGLKPVSKIDLLNRR